MYAVIKPSTIHSSRFQVEIYDGYQLKEIVRNGFDQSEAVSYAEYHCLEIKAKPTR